MRTDTCMFSECFFEFIIKGIYFVLRHIAFIKQIVHSAFGYHQWFLRFAFPVLFKQITDPVADSGNYAVAAVVGHRFLQNRVKNVFLLSCG